MKAVASAFFWRKRCAEATLLFGGQAQRTTVAELIAFVLFLAGADRL